MPSPISHPAPGAAVLLNEILFLPAETQAQFVEFKNVGADTSLTGLRLVNEKKEIYTLPNIPGSFAHNAILLVLFDGGNGVQATTVHADRKEFLNRTSGFLELQDADGMLLDRVAWGTEPRAVRISYGGVEEEASAGLSIGRVPDSTRRRNPNLDYLNWVSYRDQEVTPGAANPYPRVQVLLPISGAFFPASEPVALSWYPVPGAVEYKVQIASDESFQSLATEQSVKTPYFSASLKASDYFWRLNAPFKKVVLFDEIESAHKNVLKLLITIANGKPLKLSDGKKTSFENTLIFLTSNIAHEKIQYLLTEAHGEGEGEGEGMGFRDRRKKSGPAVLSAVQQEALDQKIYRAASRQVARVFPTALMSRLRDNIVVFRPLSLGTREKIVQGKLLDIQKMFMGIPVPGRSVMEWHLSISSSSKNLLRTCYLGCVISATQKSPQPRSKGF